MRNTCAYAVVAKDGYLLLHTIRGSADDAILAYELFYKKNWEAAMANSYQIISIGIIRDENDA